MFKSLSNLPHLFGQNSDSLLDRMFVKPDRNIIRESSGKGVLEDLIRLEKRGGRAAPME